MFKRIFWWSLLGCFCAPAMAAPGKMPVTLNLGSHTEFFGAVQDDTSGGLRSFELAPVLGLGTQINAPKTAPLKLLPEFNWVLPRKAGSSKIIKNLFMFRADIGYSPMEWFRLRVGSSLMLANQHGRGGSNSMNNGNDQSRFFYPDENRSSWNNTFDLGFELFPVFLPKPRNWSLRLQTYTYSFFKEQQRQHSYSLFWTYSWGKK